MPALIVQQLAERRAGLSAIAEHLVPDAVILARETSYKHMTVVSYSIASHFQPQLVECNVLTSEKLSSQRKL